MDGGAQWSGGELQGRTVSCRASLHLSAWPGSTVRQMALKIDWSLNPTTLWLPQMEVLGVPCLIRATNTSTLIEAAVRFRRALPADHASRIACVSPASTSTIPVIQPLSSRLLP